VIGTQTSTSDSGGIVSLNANTFNNSQIYMDYFYETNNESFNSTRYWIIDTTEGRSYSIHNFLTRFNTYTSAGLFGFDNFGRALLSFLLLVLLTAGLTYRYGIVNEAAIMGIIFGVVLFLDSIGFMVNPSIPGLSPKAHLIPIITGVIFLGLLIREELR
jgi:hypothetical protein